MADHPNVILIVIDTLRKDYAKPLENLLKNIGFVSYENVISTAPWTTPSHASIFTGLYPALHGAHETKSVKDYDVRLNMRLSLLSTRIRNLGYVTYLLSANPHITPYFGFEGFDYFYDTYRGPERTFLDIADWLTIREIKIRYGASKKVKLGVALLKERKYSLLMKALLNEAIKSLSISRIKVIVNKKWPLDKGGEYTFRKLIEVMKKDKDSPKFIFVNIMEVHEPYFVGDTPEEYSRENFKSGYLNKRIVEIWRQKYHEEVKYVTYLLRKTLTKLKNLDVLRNTLIIVTSDHGQLLGEHGRIRHGTFLYDELLCVPLFIKYPDHSAPDNIIAFPTCNNGKGNSKHLSLRMLYNFVLDYVKGKIKDISEYYEDFVFSESYGIEIDPGVPKNEQERRNIEQLEKYRVAIYYKQFKGIFNVSNWSFEELVSHNSRVRDTDNIIDSMKKEVMRFLKLATATKLIGKRFRVRRK